MTGELRTSSSGGTRMNSNTMISTPARDLFGRPLPSSSRDGQGGDGEAMRVKMESFRRVKPTCVSLMAIASQQPSSTSSHVPLLHDLSRIVRSLPQEAFTNSMINYLLFPITNILRQSQSPATLPDNFLEALFALLSLIISVWKKTIDGVDVKAWEQLWKFVISSIGPRLESGMMGKAKGKGKEREVDQEVLKEAVNVLAALLIPTDSHPNPLMKELFSTMKSPLLPTLFQTISILIATSSPTPPHLQLQLSSIRLLRPLITTYLKGRHEILASVLPGLVSAMSKLVHTEGKRLNSQVGVEAAGAIEDIVVTTLNDEDLRRLGVLRTAVDDLSQLAEDWDSTEGNPGPDPSPPSPTPSQSSISTPDPFPPLSASYLAFTSTQLLSAIAPLLSSLSTHSSPPVREAASGLAHALIAHCNQSLALLLPHCLTTLLLLSGDDFDSVRHSARRKLRLLLTEDLTEIALDTTLIDLLSNAVNSLPRLITSQQESKVEELARIITAIAETTSDLPRRNQRNAIADLLGPGGNVERWGWALLNCLEFGKPTGWSERNIASKTASKGWEQSLVTSGILFIEGNSETDHSFPYLPLRYVESEKTTRELSSMLVALGRAGGEMALHSVEYFVLFAKAQRRSQIAKAVSAVWVAEKLLSGVAMSEQIGVEGKIGKRTRKMAREVTRIVVAMDDEDEEDEIEIPVEQEASEALIPVERSKGVNAITTLLDKKPLPNSMTSDQTRRLHVQAQKVLLTCVSLSSVSLTSSILGVSFRPLLLTTLYTILSHLASPHHLIQTYANTTLVNMAYHTGYASPQNLILDNVDYVINVVSQRLTYHRLSSQAPLVLIAMIRLVGEEIVPLVHDVVDEIFDALDDFHGYEILASTLLAVLVTLIEVMANETQAEGITEERMKKKVEMRRIEKPPNPQEDFENFLKWYRERDARIQETIEGVLERAPHHAWGQTKSQQPEEAETSTEEQPSEETVQPTRSQQICIQILSKSINFLTHSSPFLRSKVLSLVSNAIPVLANHNLESELLPLIDKAWPTIINRLSDPQPYVVTMAAEVIASLSEYVGDFMGKRILDHAWPKFRVLLKSQWENDRRSALGRRDGGIGTTSSFTVSHRLHLSILKSCYNVVQEVPVDDGVLWDMMIVFRVLLDRRVHDELQTEAIKFFRALGERDGDAVWVLLDSSVGSGKGIWGYLKEEGLDINDNAEILLRSC